MAEILDNPEDVIEIIEDCLKQLSIEGRSIWTPHDIDPVVNNLLELWGRFHHN